MLITKNFESTFDESGNPYTLTYMEQYKASGGTVYRDQRNNIFCMAPSMDLQCYINYLVFLNSQRENWKEANLHYLDAGLVPYIMAPSFMHDILVQNTGNLIDGRKVEKFFLKPVSFLCNGYVGGSKDVWIKKTDLAEILGVPVDKASIIDLFRSRVGR